MNNYDKIKDLIEKKKLSQGLLLALSNSLKIKLVTKIKGKEQVNTIETDIDLVKGLTTEISDRSLLSPNNYPLNFHQKQLENIYDTWDKNRETLVTIFQIINGSSIEQHHSVIELNTSAYTPDDFSESDDSFAHEFDDFESESSPENSLFEKDSFSENLLNDDENNNEIDEETAENWIDDLDNDSDIEDSFPQDEEDEEENSSEDDSFEMMIEEEGIFTSDDEGKESDSESVVGSIEEDEDWEDFMVEMPEDEAVVSEVIASDDAEISADEDMDDDWEEWLDEDNLPSHDNGEYTPEAIDWSEENLTI